MLGKLDHEIRDTEARIARERQMLIGSLQHTGHRVRETMISPRALAGFAAAGFVLGDLMRSRRRRRGPEPARPAKTLRSSLFGLLASVGMALIKARYGSPWGLASEVLQKTNGRRPANGGGDGPRRPEADWTETAPPRYSGNGADPARPARAA